MTVGRMLAIGTLKGLWALEDLDRHSPSAEELEADRRRSQAPQTASSVIRGHTRPVMAYPPAPPHRNLAREWIEANPQEWAALQDHYRNHPSAPISDLASAAPLIDSSRAKALAMVRAYDARMAADPTCLDCPTDLYVFPAA